MTSSHYRRMIYNAREQAQTNNTTYSRREVIKISPSPQPTTRPPKTTTTPKAKKINKNVSYETIQQKDLELKKRFKAKRANFITGAIGSSVLMYGTFAAVILGGPVGLVAASAVAGASVGGTALYKKHKIRKEEQKQFNIATQQSIGTRGVFV